VRKIARRVHPPVTSSLFRERVMRNFCRFACSLLWWQPPRLSDPDRQPEAGNQPDNARTSRMLLACCPIWWSSCPLIISPDRMSCRATLAD